MTNQLQHQQRRAIDLRTPVLEQYSYCLCLHVKPTTIFIAVFKLIRSLLVASTLLLNSEFSVNEVNNDLDLALGDRHKSTAAAVNILTRIIMASASAVGIYAVISGRSALLMPLYAILLVDFFFALPAFYNRDLDPSLTDMADFRTYSTANNQYTRYSLMLFSTITMIVKIYFLCVIWKCFRYLRLIELVAPVCPHMHQPGSRYPIVRVLGSVDSTDLSTGHRMAPPPYESVASSMKPPNYEEAMKSSSMSFTANPALSQQHTVVITNPTMEQQNISTYINDTIVRPTLESMVTSTESVNNELNSSASTIVHDVVVESVNQGCNNNTDAPSVEISTNISTKDAPNITAETNVGIPKVETTETRDTN